MSRDPLERYYSRPAFARPLATWLRLVCDRKVPSTQNGRTIAQDIVKGDTLAVEPCVGSGALILGLQQAGIQAAWRTVDADAGARASMWIGDWMEPPASWRPRTAAWANLLARYRQELDYVRLVVTNPPFSRAVDVVRTAWQRHPGAIVAILQRQTWYEPTQTRAPFFVEHPPDMVTIGRCPFLRPDGRPVPNKAGRRGSGDSAPCAWFVWGPDRVGLAGGRTRIIPWKSN